MLGGMQKDYITTNRMDKQETIKSLAQIIEIMRPLNIKLDAPALTPVETAYFHICALYTYLSIDEIAIGR
jgi:hypothetical protein